MSFIERLAPLRAQPGTRLTTGLDDATLEQLAASHPSLVAAMDAAGIQCVSEAKIKTARRMSQKSRIKETSFNGPDSHF